MLLSKEFINEFRELSDDLWSACTEMPVDMAEEMLNIITDKAEDLMDRLGENASAPACDELLASWGDLYSCAAEFLTSSDRIEECILLVGSPHTIDPLPTELVRCFARHRCALAALS